ncbi:OTU domain-containing protein [Corallococcus sp. M7]
MPCADHEATTKSCVSCFAADLLALDLGDSGGKGKASMPKGLDKKVNALVTRYKSDLELDSADEDYCRSLIASLNVQLFELGLRFGAQVDPRAIQPVHRDGYRERLRRMGTWVGITEFEALAALFHVRFYIAIPVRGGNSRRYEVGAGEPGFIPTPALIWSGNHYEVGTLTSAGDGTFTVSNVLQTNPLGDCGLESFLLLLYRTTHVGKRHFDGIDIEARFAMDHFRRVAKQTPPGQVLPSGNQDYYLAISYLRQVLARRMTNAEVDDALVAEAEELSVVSLGGEEKPVGGLTWAAYLKDFKKRFTLAEALLSTGSAGKRSCVANISSAANWLTAVDGVSRQAITTWDAMRTRGLTDYNARRPPFPVHTALMHTGVMVASVTDKSKKVSVFICAASNYHESRVAAENPWIYTGNIAGKPENGKGDDMHTERFCLVQLFDWIETNKIEPAGIEIVWFLEKIMCDACQTVLQRFTAYWSSQGVKVNSETDAKFTKVAAKAAKLLS